MNPKEVTYLFSRTSTPTLSTLNLPSLSCTILRRVGTARRVVGGCEGSSLLATSIRSVNAYVTSEFIRARESLVAAVSE